MSTEAYENHRDHIKKVTLLEFIPEPVEIANLATFLASDDARNMTGSIVISDTGFLVKSKTN